MTPPPSTSSAPRPLLLRTRRTPNEADSWPSCVQRSFYRARFPAAAGGGWRRLPGQSRGPLIFQVSTQAQPARALQTSGIVVLVRNPPVSTRFANLAPHPKLRVSPRAPTQESTSKRSTPSLPTAASCQPAFVPDTLPRPLAFFPSGVSRFVSLSGTICESFTAGRLPPKLASSIERRASPAVCSPRSS